MRLLSLICFLLSTFTVFNAQADQNCFDGKLPFFKNFQRATGTSEDKLHILENACDELNDRPQMSEGFSFAERLVSVASVGGDAAFGGIASSFSNLSGSKSQRAYKAKLDKIKLISNPIDRIRAVYELAAASQGTYSSKGSMSLGLSGLIIGANTPGNIIDQAAKTGTGGVCNNMAALLRWSLQQVSRYPGSSGGALGTKDFSVVQIDGKVPGLNGWRSGRGHAWIRINLPVHDKGGRLIDFTHFDLDTTWYPETFSPLFPRRSGLSSKNLEALHGQCLQVRSCLLRKVAAAALKNLRDNPNVFLGSFGYKSAIPTMAPLAPSKAAK